MSSDCRLLPVDCRWQMAKERQVQDEHSSSLPSHWKEVQISESQGKFVQKLELTSLVQLQSVLPSGKIYTWLAETCWQFWLNVAQFDTIVICYSYHMKNESKKWNHVQQLKGDKFKMASLCFRKIAHFIFLEKLKICSFQIVKTWKFAYFLFPEKLRIY